MLALKLTGDLARRAVQRVEALERRVLLTTVIPAGFVDELVDNGLSAATSMEFAPDGRLFVAQQTGAVRVIENGVLLDEPFVTIDVDSNGERGVFGIAFDANFSTNGYVYVYYTVPNGPDGSSGAFNRVARFTSNDADANPANGYTPGNTAVPGAPAVLLNLNPLSGAGNHNGGAIHFAADGTLLVAVGDNANPSHAQTLANHFGKILRMNADGSAPADNPFNDADANRAEPGDYIWALGLRNPFTTAVDPLTGLFYINDVGEGTWEEVDEGAAGANYGWPTYEGPEDDPNFGVPPVYAYSHAATGNDGGNVISGGTFYRPAAARFPSPYVGDYFFAEASRGWIRNYDPATDSATLFATGASFPVDLKTGADGSLYCLARGSGSVRRIRYTVAPPRVTGVFVGGTTWASAFRNHLQQQAAGESAFGVAIDPANQLDELPWTNLNRVSIRFSGPVDVQQGDLVVRGVNVPVYPFGGATPFAYDATTNTATWTLNTTGVSNDKLLLDLDASLGTGVADASGNLLDGEWTDPVDPAVTGDAFPSGDGTPGGGFRFRLHVLPGDVTRSGNVQGNDVTLVRNAQGSTPGGAAYSIFYDVNGTANVQGNDVTLVRNRQGHTVPSGSVTFARSSLSSSGTAPGENPWASRHATAPAAPFAPVRPAVEKKRLTDGLV